MIDIKNLTVAIEKITLLDSVTFQVKEGEKVAILGPSGAGKTTLLNVLCQQIRPTKGSVYLAGQSLSAQTDRRQYADLVGIIRQHYDLIDALSVRQNVLAGHLRHMSWLQSLSHMLGRRPLSAVEQALNRVKLADRHRQKAANLSGGEKQRVAIARLIVQNPRVMLADEPIASLDPALAVDILKLLIDISAQKTLVVSIHHVAHALAYFERIIGIKKGRLAFDLPANQVAPDHIKALYHD